MFYRCCMSANPEFVATPLRLDTRRKPHWVTLENTVVREVSSAPEVSRSTPVSAAADVPVAASSQIPTTGA